jgi:ATP-dependent DNA helicase RecG
MGAMDFDTLFDVLQNSDETEKIEAKRASSSIGESFLSSVSAFSNEPCLGGGYILLGVSENLDQQESKY